MKYDRKAIMAKAHKLYRTFRYGTFANALKLAWQDAKAVAEIRAEHGEVRTWYGWTLVGREVIHEQHAVAKVKLADPKTADGTRLTPFFTYEQTCELGTQPPKVA